MRFDLSNVKDVKGFANASGLTKNGVYSVLSYVDMGFEGICSSVRRVLGDDGSFVDQNFANQFVDTGSFDWSCVVFVSRLADVDESYFGFESDAAGFVEFFMDKKDEIVEDWKHAHGRDYFVQIDDLELHCVDGVYYLYLIFNIQSRFFK